MEQDVASEHKVAGSISNYSPEFADKGTVTKPGDVPIPIEDTGASSSTSNSNTTIKHVLSVKVKDSKSMEIIKSIVYGGLIASITSLGVISSAAASDADTLKIVTIGVANLIGGLFIICLNLMDLKNNNGRGGSLLSDQVNRYQELLGQKENFLLHATFALVSYLVFGLVPPVVYGFTFRKSDDSSYKLIAAVMASLMCVVMLATAKAHTQGANKFSKHVKTVLYYGIAASMVSGIGYAAGHFINRFLDKLGWFDSKPTSSLLILKMDSQNLTWSSY